MSFFKPCQKMSPLPLVNDMNSDHQGEVAREKLITFFLKRRMMFCYHVNTFLTVILLSEKFT